MKTELEKLRDCDPFCYLDEEIAAIKAKALELCCQYNAHPCTDRAGLEAILRRLFGSLGKNPSVMPHFYCDHGVNIHAGDNLIVNFNVTILDIARVDIGHNCMIAPHVGIYTVFHPLTVDGRRQSLAQGKPISIGDDVWIGGSAAILPGVTIGRGAVVAAGSVVNRDVREKTLVAGNPAKLIKHL